MPRWYARQRVQRALGLAAHVVEDDDDREVDRVGRRRRRERRAVAHSLGRASGAASATTSRSLRHAMPVEPTPLGRLGEPVPRPERLDGRGRSSDASSTMTTPPTATRS